MQRENLIIKDMKRILLSALLIGCVVFAQAQVLTVSYNGVDLQNGDTVSLKAGANDEIQFAPTVHNNGSSSRVCRFVAEKLNNTSTEIMSMCTGMLCMSGYSSAPFRVEGNSVYDEVHIDFIVPADAAPGLFKFSVYDTNIVSVSFDFYARVYNKNSVGIAEANQDCFVNAFPNPAVSTVNVSYSNADANSELVVYNMTGSVVREVSLNGSEGCMQVDVSSLPAGVYMYGIKSRANVYGIKKLVVK